MTRPSSLPPQHREPWNLASEPEFWGQGTLLAAGAAANTQRRLLMLKNIAHDGRPQRVVVATHYVSTPVGGANNEQVVVRVNAGIGAIRQDYLIDAGSSLAVNADALEVTAVARTVIPVDVNVLATVARGGEAIGRLSGATTVLTPGGAAFTDTVPLGAAAVSFVLERAEAELDIRILGRLPFATPLWQTDGSDLAALQNVPIGPQPVFLRLALGAAAPASLRVYYQWVIRA